MEQIALTIKRVLSFNREQKYNYNNGCFRMSDLNHTYASITSSNKKSKTNNESLTMSKEESLYFTNNNMTSIDDSNIKSALEILYMTANSDAFQTAQLKFEESNDSEISKTISLTNLEQINDMEKLEFPFEIRRENHKDIIVINSRPNKDAKNLNVIKLKIKIPSSKNKSDEKISSNKENSNTLPVKETKRITNAPIMGKNALLKKLKDLRNQENPKSDSEIVQELVTDRFGQFLNEYYQKSLQRQTSRVNRKSFDNSEIGDSNECIFNNRELAHSTFNEYSAHNYVHQDSSKSSTDSGSYHVYTSSDLDDNSDEETISALNSLGSLLIGSLGDLKEELNLQFLLSTDENNVETSDDQVVHTSNCDGSTVSYDAAKFLEAALGEEWKNYVSTDSANVSDIERDENFSIGTSNISDLVSKASSYASAPTRNKSSATYEDQPYYHETFPFSKKLSDLILESNIQNQIMIQVTKALGVCKNTKEFVSSIEEIEAERILLQATLKREALREEIQRLEYEEIGQDLSSNFGTVKITGLTLPLKHISSLLSNMIDKKKSREYSNWFVFAITSGATVFVSKPVRSNDDGLVKFEESFLLTDLPSDFVVNISIYSMRIRNNLRNYSHESKFHLNKNIKTLCPSPQKLFQITKDLKGPKQNKDEALVSPSSFIFDGKCVLRINNLRELGYFKLAKMPSSSLLEGGIIVHFASQVNINEDNEDFLNIGTDSGRLGEGVTWNRRWCSLKAHQLFIYNYPGQEEPLSFIDLTYCASATINQVDRTLCPRSKTLLLETISNDNNQECIHSSQTLIIRYFLTADTNESMKIWQDKLNNTISALRNWNFMKS